MMLTLQNITKDYEVADTKVHALKGIDLEFRKNEFVCILGASGCGKTTLLNIIGGLDQYTSGDLIIQGKSTKAFTDRDWDVYRNHKIGFIFQSYNLIPHQTVLGNVEIALTIAGIGKTERRARAIAALERVGLKSELNKRPNQLSGGQMQRVAIARALVNNPAILLADEPTGALDSVTSVQIMDLIREIAGERLVIMVTHNPELAEEYASRIVRLKDGLVESDSNPYDGTEDRARMHEIQLKRKEELKRNRKEVRKARKRRYKNKKASMSYFASLALSARNLLTKKGRTVVTSIAGSIGIISVCLVLAMSNGFNNYILKTEEDMLSYYPIEITESAFDMTSIMAGAKSASEMPDLEQLGDKVYVNSFLTEIAQGMTVTNNLSEEYLAYVEGTDESLYNAIQYDYGTQLSDNLFTTVQTGEDEESMVTRHMALSELKTFYTNELTMKAKEYAQLAYMVDYLGGIVHKMPDTSDFSDEGFGDYVLSQYDVVAGEFPKASNEALLVIGGNNDMTDLTLAQLGFIDEPTFLSLFDLGEEVQENEGESDYLTIPFEEIQEKEFVLYYNDAVYQPSVANPLYPFEYSGERANLDVAEGQGVKIKISGILRLKEDLTYGCLSSGINLTESLIDEYIQVNMQSKIVQWMNGPTSSTEYVNGDISVKFYFSPAKHLTDNKFYQPLSSYKDYFPEGTTLPDMYIGVDRMQENALRALGGSDVVKGISIYAKDFETKEDLLARLNEWNDTHGEDERVTYTDTVGTLMSLVQTMLDAITYVLVAFTAISLVVSSVMIGIITYVSVVERVKEIGVLRSLGARKKDIKHLFNAETFIIGLASGAIGVGVTYLLSIVINVIMQSLTGIVGIAALKPSAAITMVIVSVVLTLISGLIPASAAAKKDPVIALRTE